MDYGNNTYIKDSIKKLHDNPVNNDWCSTISIQNLIKAGYLKSDDDFNDQITDVFTGGALGFNSLGLYSNEYPLNAVALCYCSNKLDIEAMIINDLGKDNVYHEGEFVRNINYSIADDNISFNKYEFKELKVSFIYNDLAKRVIQALKNNRDSVTVEGVKIEFGNYFESVGTLSLANELFVKTLNDAIFSYLTYDSACPSGN